MILASPTRSTNEALMNTKELENKAALQMKNQEAQRIMKASHFDVGAKDGTMLHPKPIKPIDQIV